MCSTSFTMKTTFRTTLCFPGQCSPSEMVSSLKKKYVFRGAITLL